MKLGINTIFELSLFHPSTQRQETRSLHIWPSPLSGSEASPPQGRKTMTHPEGQGGVPVRHIPAAAQAGKAWSLLCRFCLRMQRPTPKVALEMCVCVCVCVCSVLLEEGFSQHATISVLSHVSRMLPLCQVLQSAFKGPIWTLETRTYCYQRALATQRCLHRASLSTILTSKNISA